MSETAPHKVCVLCGEDCSGKPRIKDPKGRYYCRECYERALEERRHRQEAEAAAAASPAEPEIEAAHILDLGLDDGPPPAPAGIMCPGCATALEAGTVLCTNCGYSFSTGQRLEVKTKKAERSGPGAGSGATAFLISPQGVSVIALATFGILFAIAISNPIVAMLFFVVDGVFSLAVVITVLVFAFSEGIGQGFLTLCLPFYVLYFVYGVCDNVYVRWLFSVYLITTVGNLYLQYSSMGAGF